jgi:hypothetical protein
VRYWAGILLSPASFLTQLSVSYALISAGCSGATFILVNASIGASLLIALIMTVFSWRLGSNEHQTAAPMAAATIAVAAAGGSRSFLALLGIAINVIICLVSIAQWITVFTDPACGF